MKRFTKFYLASLLLLLSISGTAFSQVPQLISYQSLLLDPATGQPVADAIYQIVFSIYDVASGGSATWTETQDVQTKNGLYAVLLGSTTVLSSAILSGPEKYLGIKVGADAEATPRRRIVSVAYAIVSANADSLGGQAAAEYSTKSELSTSDGDPPNAGSNQVNWNNLTDVPPGFVDGVDDAGAGGNSWSLTGNNGTTAGTHFLGTTDDVALQVHVNGQRALRIEPDATSPNIVGGFSGNNVTAGVKGATIGGGGLNGSTNAVSADFGTVGGGQDNNASETNATVGGGFGNSAEETYATVGGGRLNINSGNSATIGGGNENSASGSRATVGGGHQNIASGDFATVPGGFFSTAAGDYSFAAGRSAKANHHGAFVWADQTNANFASTGEDQFLIRASGGVGIGETNPSAMLDVVGTTELNGDVDINSDLDVDTNTLHVDGTNNRVGIGTPSPNAKLHIAGAAGVDGIRFPDGTLQTTAAGGSNDWSLTGNSDTNPGTHFLGTTDNNALEIHVNNQRALRIEPDATSPNIVGGFSGNNVTAGVKGATIGGGGENNSTNLVTDDFGTVGGGIQNRAGNNTGTTSNANFATVGGGVFNDASASYATVGGGEVNSAIGAHATVGGGLRNLAEETYATVGGGARNSAEQIYATVGGGDSNIARGIRATVGGGVTTSPAGCMPQCQADFSAPPPAITALRPADKRRPITMALLCGPIKPMPILRPPGKTNF